MAKNRNNSKNQKRPHKQLSIIEGPRVRYAPSPTGPFHLGAARTVLFNWLFARKYGGSFILRIEDTDIERSKPEFEKDIIDGIRWLGLDYDEGPGIETPYGPYRQSERRHVYKKYIGQLLAKGHVYRCFCSEEDLDAVRQDMISRGLPPKYNGRCRALSEQEVQDNVNLGKPFVLRVKMPEKRVVFEDLIRGTIEFDMSLAGDIAIARGDDMPLYNLAAVIDDCEMKISHVIRGEDHISNTPKQIVLQDMLGLTHPEYAHLPLILGPDRSKLSKRHGAVSINEYRKDGYLPEAIVNFLSLLGWHPAGDREMFTRDELIKEFSLERVQKAGAVFMQSRLDWLNSHYLKNKLPEELVESAAEFLERAGLIIREGEKVVNPENREEISRAFIAGIVSLERERIHKLSLLPESTEFFFKRPHFTPDLLVWREMSLDDVMRSMMRLEEMLGAIHEDEFTKEKLDQALAPFYGEDKGALLWPFRVALTGRRTSPGPFEISEVLGKKEVMFRIRYAKGLLEKI